MSSSNWIYNVSPDQVLQSVGQFGMYTIPGKKADEPYSRTLIKDVPYLMDRGDDKFDPVVQSGAGIIQDILSVNNTLGLFKSPNAEPTEDEVQAARDNLFTNDTIRIASADATWQKRRDRGLINDQARQAARRRNATKEWMDTVSGDVSKRCPLCDEEIRAAAKICKHCGNRVDSSSLPAVIPAATETETKNTISLRR